VKALVRDVDALRALRPQDVAVYLRARGWSVDGTVGPFTRYARGANGDRAEIEVPRGSEYRDFALRMAEVLEAIARFEKRSQIDVLQDLSVAGADVVRVRLVGSELGDGSVPLEDGALLVERVRDVMLASACATVHPRGFFGTRKPTEAVDYVRKLRLGQTERGSFVVKVLSPVAPLLSMEEAGVFFPETEPPPFERRVTETLLQGAEAARGAAMEAGATGILAPFEEAVARGASANLCDGLASMLLMDRPYAALELSVAWAGNRPAPSLVDRVRVTREVAPLLASAAQQLKAKAPREDFEIEGYVVALDNPDTLRLGGTIVVAAAIDDKTRRVRVALGAEDYRVAIDAHARMARVSCAGRLQKSGRQYELRDAQEFTIIPDD
jgi:hypothetical protein